MCNIAGYVGERAAAPILIEMMRRQEGFAGGFFTGIATMHEGKLYYEKLTGDLEHLLVKTEAGALPGNIGIIHSRSYCGGTGGDLWAHPFVGEISGRVMTAYVANGSAGRFAVRQKEFGALADGLIQQGCKMPSRIYIDSDRYTKLSDGRTAHMSDVMCQLITRNIRDGQDAVRAMGEAFCEMPSEIVGLLLSLTEPNAIVWSRINRPMMLSFARHGAYLATTAMAFPGDGGAVQSLPPLASGRVYKDHVSVTPYTAPPAKVGEVTPQIMAQAYDQVCKILAEGPVPFSEIEKCMMPLFDTTTCPQDAWLGYEILRSLEQQDKLDIQTQYVPGVAEDLLAPKFTISLKV